MKRIIFALSPLIISGCMASSQSAIVHDYDSSGNIVRTTHVAPDPQIAYQESSRVHSQEQTKQVQAYMGGMTGMLDAASRKGVSTDAMAILAFVAVQRADNFKPTEFVAERSPTGYDALNTALSRDSVFGSFVERLPGMVVAREAGKTLRTFADGFKGDTTTVTASDSASVNFEQTNQDQEVHATAVGDGASAAVSGATQGKGSASAGQASTETDSEYCADTWKPETYEECVARSRECNWTNENGTNISHWNGTGVNGQNATDCEGRFGVEYGSDQYSQANG
jgi:hypothetical protein